MLAVIITLLIFVACAVATVIVGVRSKVTTLELAIGLAIVAIIVLLSSPCVFYATGRFAGGVMPQYSTGTRTGYITKVSRKGMFWQTNEAEMQVGVGQMAAVQVPFSFSIVNQDVLDDVSRYEGTDTRITVSYSQWLVQPLWRGRSGYEAVGVSEQN